MGEAFHKYIGSDISVLSGFAFPSNGFTESDGLPLVRIRDLESKKTEVRYRGTYDERYMLQDGDVLVGMDGDFLAVRWRGGPALLNQRVCKVTAIPGGSVDQVYLFHSLQPQLDAIHRRTPQTTVRHLSTKDILAIACFLPPLSEQRRIAEILDTVDAAIRKTEQVIAKLQQMKQGLLHDLLTCGIDEHGHLRNPQTHPEQFKDSPLGRIPKDWEVRPLVSAATIERGKFTHRPRNDSRFYGGSIPFIQTGDVTATNGGIVTAFSQTLNARGATVSKEFPECTIAITIAANIADTAILGIPMYFPDSVVGAIVQPPNNTRFVELTIRRAKPRLEARAPQSAQKNINLQDLRPLLTAFPRPMEQDRIAAVYAAHMTRLDEEAWQHNKLRTLKQGLMDDLLTGRVRVSISEETTA